MKKEEPEKQSLDYFAQCITDAGAIMYGTEWCPHCKNQKAVFGDSFIFIEYVDCDLNQKKCVEAGIKGFPTWIIDGKPYSGEQPLYRLRELTGCSYQSNDEK